MADPVLEPMVMVRCINKTETVKRSFIFSDNTYRYLMQLIFLHIALVSLSSNLLRLIFKPLGLTSIVALLSIGLVFGSSGLGRFDSYQKIFLPSLSSIQFQTMGLFGVMVYLFLVGVKMDLGIIKRSSKKAWIIGISTFIIPMVFTVPWAFILSSHNPEIGNLPMFAIMVSSTSFHVVNCLLTELKILNTELGRLATSISTISGMFSWITSTISFALAQQQNSNQRRRVPYGELYFAISTFSIVIFIAVGIRKYVIWVIKSTPNGEVVKDIHVVAIFLMIFGTGFLGEVFGLHCLFGPIILGLAIPDGKPVGSTLSEKLEYPIMSILLPIFFFSIGVNTDVDAIIENQTTSMWILIFQLLGTFGKLIGTMIPCLIYQIPMRDAVILSLILSTLGIFDIATYSEGLFRTHVNHIQFAMMIFYALATAAFTSSLVYWFYNPSRKYIIHKHRTIQNAKNSSELRLLLCIYNDKNVPTIVNLLEASNPTRRNPIFVYLLHIIELQGRSMPLLITHQLHDKLSNKSIPSEHIINCFRIYEKQSQGAVIVQPFTTMTHFVSAHDDICALAFDKKTSMIIIPFHKQWTIEGIIESSKCRNVNKKVLNTAPCSVGILIDRGMMNHVAKSVVTCWSTYIIGVIFLGDADDREALYYALHMAEHPNISLVVHRFVPVNITLYDMNEKILDDNLINEYRLHNVANEGNMYREEVVKDGVEILSLTRTLDTSYDLILVGRSQNNYSSLFSGLVEWNEYPELGFFGDMFASSDFKGNIPVLVVQQHSAIGNRGAKDEELVSRSGRML